MYLYIVRNQIENTRNIWAKNMTSVVQVNLLFCHHRLSLSSSFAVDGQEEKTSKKCVKLKNTPSEHADPAEMICVVHEISRADLRRAF